MRMLKLYNSQGEYKQSVSLPTKHQIDQGHVTVRLMIQAANNAGLYCKRQFSHSMKLLRSH